MSNSNWFIFSVWETLNLHSWQQYIVSFLKCIFSQNCKQRTGWAMSRITRAAENIRFHHVCDMMCHRKLEK